MRLRSEPEIKSDMDQVAEEQAKAMIEEGESRQGQCAH